MTDIKYECDHCENGSGKLCELWKEINLLPSQVRETDYEAWCGAIAELAATHGITMKDGYSRNVACQLIDEGFVGADHILSIFLLTLGPRAQSS
jgi:hypothetical protein